jgi:hypothetical protein
LLGEHAEYCKGGQEEEDEFFHILFGRLKIKCLTRKRKARHYIKCEN